MPTLSSSFFIHTPFVAMLFLWYNLINNEKDSFVKYGRMIAKFFGLICVTIYSYIHIFICHIIFSFIRVNMTNENMII